MGVHSEYKPSYIKKVTKYLKEREDDYFEFINSRGHIGHRLRVRLPSIEHFATWLGVSRKTLYNWRDAHDDFKEALERIHDVQLERLISGGLSGVYNPTISKLMLSSNHGMKERVDNTSKDEPISHFTDEQVDRIADRLLSRKRKISDPSSEAVLD